MSDSSDLNTPDVNSPDSDIHEAVEPARPSNKKYWLIGGFWLVLVAILVFAVMRANNAAEQRQQVIAQEPWDERLLACNSVVNAEPNEAFDTCLEIANEGWIDAASRIAWAYSRDGEYQNWQEAYNWLVWLSDYDDYAKLLSHIVMFEIGDSEKLKLSGERGITQMAVVNEPAASAYLASLYYLELNKLEQRSSIQWLLDRAYNESLYWVSPEQIAHLYVNGFVGEPDPDKAKALLLDASDEDFPFNANNVAWTFATNPNPGLTDYPTALELAQQVVEVEEHANNYVYVDTLAAAYAANEEFEQAVSTQQTAIELLSEAIAREEAPKEELASFEERLAMFKAQEVYKESFLASSGDDFFEALKKQVEQALIENLFVTFAAPQTTKPTSNSAATE